MIRKLITIILPLLLPTLIYFFWVWMARRQKIKNGGEEIDDKILSDAPWIWLGIGGCGLLAVTLLITPLVLGKPSKPGEYVAPQYKEGKIIPGHYAK